MNTFFVIICLMIILIGVFFVSQILRSKNYEGDAEILEHKDGLPILPRDQRQQPQTDTANNETDTLSQEIMTDSENKTDALSNLAKIASQDPNQPDNPPVDLPITEEVQIDTSAPMMPKPTEQMIAAKQEKFAEPSNEFTQNSPMLDRHLSEQQQFDQNNDPLLNAKDTVTIVISPRNQFSALSGKEILNLVRTYGLKYGVMNMYHRYEREDGTGDLWFSMLGVNHEGVQAFDLNTLPDNYFTGLSLFLSLPHPHALRGYNSMVSVARMIAKDLDADIHDEQGYLLDDAYLEKIRLQITNYH